MIKINDELRKYCEVVRDEENDMHVLFRFPNGYGASVIRHLFSYGYEEGLFELAVIKWKGKKFTLVYDTPITNDVIGWLDDNDVEKYLFMIIGLEMQDDDVTEKV